MNENVQGRLCHLIVASRQEDLFDEKDLISKLRSDDVESKRIAMKTIIRCLSSGFQTPSIFLEVINHVSKNNDHYLKKLWFLFWEIMPKTGSDGQPVPEVILACDSFLKDLTHPNEFLRGSVLRFMSKVREPVVLQAIFNYVIEGLKHREPYVRRNAVLAIFSIHKNFPNIIGNVPEIITSYLERESSLPCKRNAFITLLHIDQDRALNYLIHRIDSVTTFGDTLQLTVIELIFKVCKRDPYLRPRFIRCVYSLLNSESPAVRFESANTLMLLTTLPSAVKEVAKCYIELVSAENDINVSLVVLRKLSELAKSVNKSILEDSAVEMLRMLSCDDFSVRKEVLGLVIQFISQRNASQLVTSLKIEFIKFSSDEMNENYKKVLISSLKACCLKFPHVVDLILPTFVDQLCISSESVCDSIMDLVRSCFTVYSDHSTLLNFLFSSFPHIRFPSCLVSVVWLCCEFASSVAEIQSTFNHVSKLFAEIVSACSPNENEECEKVTENKEGSQCGKTRLLLMDGSYATQTFAGTKHSENGVVSLSILGFVDRDLMFHVSSICGGLIKLLKQLEIMECDLSFKNSLFSQAMLFMVSVLCYLDKCGKLESVDQSEIERIESSISFLLDSPLTDESSFLKQFRDSFDLAMNTWKDKDIFVEKVHDLSEICSNLIDTQISFRFLTNLSNDIESDGQQDYFSSNELVSVKKESSSLNQTGKVFQLTGMADVVYAEAMIEVNHCTIWLDVSVYNQTPDTLQNFSLELAVIGDMTVLNRPQSTSLAAKSCLNISTSVRLSSLQNGVIFGSLVYDTRGALNDRCYVILNDIRIDLIDHIIPSLCGDDDFRKMWTEFEWENKIQLSTNTKDLREMLEYILTITKMNCLTPKSMLNYDLGFVSANLYAKSIFGDSILANLSIEGNQFNSEISGHIRIRSMTQSIAVSFGERINENMRKR